MTAASGTDPVRLIALDEVPELAGLQSLEVHRDGAVLAVVNDRPEVLNAHDRTMVAELRRVWRHFGSASGLNVAMLTAAGTRSFSTGLDVDDTLSSGLRARLSTRAAELR